jgi:Tol biopolymer transport system component
VWGRIAVCVVLGGCGFQSRPGPAGDLPSDGAPGGDPPGAGSDAGSDGGSGAGSDSGSASCLERWRTGGAALALSQPLPLLATGAEDHDPWISPDGRLLYFSRNPGVNGLNTDIYAATRGSTALEFLTAGPVVNLDTPADESRAAVGGDDKLLVFSSNRGTAGSPFQIFVSKRTAATDPFGSPAAQDQALVASVNTGGNGYFDPFLSPDGLHLYLAPLVAGKQQIALATRAAGQNFGPAAALRVINSSTSSDADPALSPDELILVFTSLRAAGAGLGGSNLWYATRQNATDDFSPPQLIPGVNSNVQEGDPMLSADGCELYFASNRAGDGNYHLFRATMAPQH